MVLDRKLLFDKKSSWLALETIMDQRLILVVVILVAFSLVPCFGGAEGEKGPEGGNGMKRCKSLWLYK